MKLNIKPHSRVMVESGLKDARFPPIFPAEFKLEKILVPVDFSPLSRKALHYALAFAGQFHAEILLLHVVEPLPAGPDMFPTAGMLANAATRKNAIRGLSNWRKSVPTGVLLKTRVVNGVSHHEIVRSAREHNMDLIIIGTHGRRGLMNYFLGGTAKRVVRHAPCPVLVVREQEHDFVTKLESEGATKKLKPRKPNHLNKN